MSLFKLITAKRFSEFCEIYEKNAQFQNQDPEFSDLTPKNYILALMGDKRYNKVIDVCCEEIFRNDNRSNGPDRSSDNNYIACSIAQMELHMPDAIDTLYKGRNAAYQSISRTELPCIMYYEAVMLNDEKAKKQSLKLLEARLKNNKDPSYEFAVAQFITGRYTEEELLEKINSIVPILLERYKAKALFYIAVKEYEKGNKERYIDLLYSIENLYYKQPFIVIEWEYLLSHICIEKEESSKNESK